MKAFLKVYMAQQFTSPFAQEDNSDHSSWLHIHFFDRILAYH